jgi:hypothetical protein
MNDTPPSRSIAVLWLTSIAACGTVLTLALSIAFATLHLWSLPAYQTTPTGSGGCMTASTELYIHSFKGGFDGL